MWYVISFLSTENQKVFLNAKVITFCKYFYYRNVAYNLILVSVIFKLDYIKKYKYTMLNVVLNFRFYRKNDIIILIINIK